MKKDTTYKSADLSAKTVNYIKELERNLSQQMGKDIALVAYAKNDGGRE